MNVYIVGVAVDYEGEELLAVYSEASTAIEYASQIIPDAGEAIFVEERILNSESAKIIWISGVK